MTILGLYVISSRPTQVLDRGLPSYVQNQINILATDRVAVVCELVSGESKAKAKTIDLCNHPRQGAKAGHGQADHFGDLFEEIGLSWTKRWL